MHPREAADREHGANAAHRTDVRVDDVGCPSRKDWQELLRCAQCLTHHDRCVDSVADLLRFRKTFRRGGFLIPTDTGFREAPCEAIGDPRRSRLCPFTMISTSGLTTSRSANSRATAPAFQTIARRDLHKEQGCPGRRGKEEGFDTIDDHHASVPERLPIGAWRTARSDPDSSMDGGGPQGFSSPVTAERKYDGNRQRNVLCEPFDLPYRAAMTRCR